MNANEFFIVLQSLRPLRKSLRPLRLKQVGHARLYLNAKDAKIYAKDAKMPFQNSITKNLFAFIRVIR